MTPMDRCAFTTSILKSCVGSGFGTQNSGPHLLAASETSQSPPTRTWSARSEPAHDLESKAEAALSTRAWMYCIPCPVTSTAFSYSFGMLCCAAIWQNQYSNKRRVYRFDPTSRTSSGESSMASRHRGSRRKASHLGVAKQITKPRAARRPRTALPSNMLDAEVLQNSTARSLGTEAERAWFQCKICRKLAGLRSPAGPAASHTGPLLGAK